MCISCGCGKPDDDHGDPRNITMQDLDQAARAAGTTRDRVLQNIMQGSQPGTSSNGQGQQGQQGNTQFQSHQDDSNRSQAEENKYAQAQAQPGTYQPSPGHESGTAWGQDQEQINYQPPEEQKHTS